MRLIIGGTGQGKTMFAKELLGLNDEQITDGESCDYDRAFDQPVLKGLHVLIKRLNDDGYAVKEYFLQGIEKNSDITIISDELGTGVIPILREDREIQELVGRIQCVIAQRASHVYRIYCSIPALIKGDKELL